MTAGKQVLLYLVDGRPGGVRTAEIANWTGHVVAAPRSDVAALLARDEPRRTGVYLLLGDDPLSSQSSAARVYIGEGDEVAARLKKHATEKDWWDRVVVVTSQAQAQQLTKSQVRYLESRLITRAKASGQATLDNSTDPAFAKLSEAETANMDFFLEQLDVLLPAIGVEVFRSVESPASTPTPGPASPSGVSPIFTLRGKKQGVEARAQLIDGQFVVLAGSTAVPAVSNKDAYMPSTVKVYAGFEAIRSSLAQSQTLLPDGGLLRFAKNTPFTSSSTAGSIVLGRSCNGRTSWIDEYGVTFGEWEAQGIDGDGEGPA